MPVEGCKVSVAVCVLPLYCAIIVAFTLLATEPAAAENCALVEPAGTETAAGAESEEALLDRVTLAPPEPAPWDKVTVHVVVPPDAMLVGVQATEVSVTVAATNVIDAVCELPLKVAVITAPEPLRQWL